MEVYLNGSFRPEAEASLSIHDRGFLYGDGLFETLLIQNGTPFRWKAHWERLATGAEVLGIPLSHSPEELLQVARQLALRNRLDRCLIRLAVSRGPGERGYTPPENPQPTWLMTLHPAPALDSTCPVAWTVVNADLRVPARDPLSRIKSANKLMAVLARQEARTCSVDDALLWNTEGRLAESACGNVFLIREGRLLTPPLEDGALPGVTRGVILDLVRDGRLGLKAEESGIDEATLAQAEGVFLTLSSFGVVEVVKWENSELPRSPYVQQIHQAYQAMIKQECSA